MRGLRSLTIGPLWIQRRGRSVRHHGDPETDRHRNGHRHSDARRNCDSDAHTHSRTDTARVLPGLHDGQGVR